MSAIDIVDVAVDAGVAVVTLNDPDRRNVLSAEMVSSIVATFDELESDDDCGAIVVTGAGSAFCAGADLSHLARVSQSGLREVYKGFLRVARSPIPTIAAVNGPAVGAGMNLALACDLRIVSDSGRFDTRFMKLGLHPGGGHTWMLRDLVGPQAASAMVLFGQVVVGQAAVDVGLAWSRVRDDELLDTARAIAAVAASAPRSLPRRVKATIADMTTIDDLDAAVDHELVAQVWSMSDPAFQARLAEMQAKITGD